MAGQSINLETPLKVYGGDGTVLYEGSAWLGVCQVVKATTAITQADAVALDPATFLLQADNLAATATIVANVLGCRPAITTGSYDRGLVGVALGTAAANALCAVAGEGSIVTVKTASATGTIGRHVLCSSTAGSVTDSATAPTNPVQSPGYTVKPSGTTGGVTDTGTATRLGILVAVH